VAATHSCSCYFFEILLLQAATYSCAEEEYAGHLSPETSIWIFTGVSLLWELGGKGKAVMIDTEMGYWHILDYFTFWFASGSTGFGLGFIAAFFGCGNTNCLACHWSASEQYHTISSASWCMYWINKYFLFRYLDSNSETVLMFEIQALIPCPPPPPPLFL